MRTILYPFILLFLLVFSAHAQIEAPDVLLNRLTQEMISALRAHDNQLRAQPKLIYQMVDEIIAPHVDWPAMARWVIGRQVWLQASSSQRERFVAEFKNLLIHTYASTLRTYNNQTIDYLPLRGGSSDKIQVQVGSIIHEPGKESIRVNYRLVKQQTAWKVYDISIEGVSLLKGFQSQFADELQRYGLDKLIEQIHEHNQKRST